MRDVVETRSILGTRIRQWMAETAERICVKFTQKTCLVPPSGEFEDKDQRSEAKVTRDKKWHFSALSAACVRFMSGKTSLASGLIVFYT